MHHLIPQQSLLLQHGLNRRISASEQSEGLRWIVGVARRVDVLAHSLSHLLVETVARLQEGIETVRIQHFRPQIHIVG